MDTITVTSLKSAVAAICARMSAKHDELNALDGRLGDGDIGITMKAGCQAISGTVDEWPEDVGMSLFACARAFVGTRASSFGTLVATGLMAAAKGSKGQKEIPVSDIASLLQPALDAMAARGKSEVGQKTVLDAVAAAAEAARGYTGHSASELIEVIHRAVSAAVRTYAERPSGQGRARIFGEKTVGIPDPGMVVFLETVEALRDTATGDAP